MVMAGGPVKARLHNLSRCTEMKLQSV